MIGAVCVSKKCWWVIKGYLWFNKSVLSRDRVDVLLNDI